MSDSGHPEVLTEEQKQQIRDFIVKEVSKAKSVRSERAAWWIGLAKSKSVHFTSAVGVLIGFAPEVWGYVQTELLSLLEPEQRDRITIVVTKIAGAVVFVYGLYRRAKTVESLTAKGKA
jgi:hypothetical protein